jgi:hypothetical protein
MLQRREEIEAQKSRPAEQKQDSGRAEPRRPGARSACSHRGSQTPVACGQQNRENGKRGRREALRLRQLRPSRKLATEKETPVANAESGVVDNGPTLNTETTTAAKIWAKGRKPRNKIASRKSTKVRLDSRLATEKWRELRFHGDKRELRTRPHRTDPKCN